MAIKKIKDVVCRKKMTAEEAKEKAEHNKIIYYFCSKRCEEKFLKAPENYLKLVG
ncbi:MAG: YHS domain-containing protein [bacterium (Candidatus Ratteibacteria) CG_4_10_14_3_um_filter_41_18]|uniref:YHS domain-containing protein n=4 Tax=Candidatus Ratteibacteria TaxID=2979319 RepID=A0A2M7YF34_9BACT|nr:MAG: YHS domain-containing protein [bacterium (Candidatus Ratteibacteria) CG01_land_8_20_14_3_00_40_19]PIW32212.1 MAG: YHS domain-containing protein [bacterium (Candidatus Ratteibacteria) CG15_BIG_FIL_POST_REV_8_21_14_020_41_12]PIX76529.1 MAG: YHS domain-containing protein [bacterium (Candidatus Ratteibacteria) CG_4_10_14_3_um_filter_41_18]PJA61592.1 MAG: YHS domain-containing protein [bacterium (Candidatus Ratteibacteria) CG_4_9_14_3_um_filter_41_21]HCG77093.1 YHS domain-containing protein 